MSEEKPLFIIVGHPNEGKSSLVSTLTENDQIPVSPFPGETLVSSEYGLSLDGELLVRIADTPGFQRPKSVLEWFQAQKAGAGFLPQLFVRRFKNDPKFTHEVELFRPFRKDSVIIYVVDGSRPLTDEDYSEIEILRLTGLPRLAVINHKEEEFDYTDEWKHSFRKSFNAIRVFNTHEATYSERIGLLEALSRIDQEWQVSLDRIIDAYRRDHIERNHRIAALVADYLEQCTQLRLRNRLKDSASVHTQRSELERRYNKELVENEKRVFDALRKEYHHSVFSLRLEEDSILSYEPLSEQSIEVLGLSRSQLAIMLATFGGIAGAGMDIAAAGLSFGVFTTVGALGGFVGSLIGSKGLSVLGNRYFPLEIAGEYVSCGPLRSVELFFVLFDRCLLFCHLMSNRAHGKREGHIQLISDDEQKRRGMVSRFSSNEQRQVSDFFSSLNLSSGREEAVASRRAFIELLVQKLE